MAPILLHGVQASVGDCFLLQFNDAKDKQQSWMIDGGPGDWKMSNSYKRAAHCLFSAINDLDIEKLQRLVVTHNDFDHTFGAYALLVRLILSSQYSDPDSVLPTSLVNVAQPKL